MADIELVIKIPEKDWEFIKAADGCRWSRAILEGVINGIPLPKRHGRLIDADELKRIIQGNDVRICDINTTQTIIEADKEESEG